MQEKSLSGSVNLLKGVNLIDIHTKCFQNFIRFSLSRVNLSQRSFELSRFQQIGGEIIIIELEWSLSNRIKVWIEILGGSGNLRLKKIGFHRSNLLSTRVDVKTYRSDHAVVLLVSTTAPQETNKTDNYSNDNQKHWTCGQFLFTNKSEVAIIRLGHSTNNN